MFKPADKIPASNRLHMLHFDLDTVLAMNPTWLTGTRNSRILFIRQFGGAGFRVPSLLQLFVSWNVHLVTS